MPIICGLFWLDDPSMPFYKQRRVGRYGVPIDIYKLYIMVVGTDEVEMYYARTGRTMRDGA